MGCVAGQRGRCDEVDSRGFEGPDNVFYTCFCEWDAIGDEGCGFVWKDLTKGFLGGHRGWNGGE